MGGRKVMAMNEDSNYNNNNNNTSDTIFYLNN